MTRNGCSAWVVTGGFFFSVLIASPGRASDAAGGSTLGQPDQPGGYATDHVLVRWAAGTAAPRVEGGQVRLGTGELDALRAAWGVSGVEAVFGGRHLWPDLAARYGLDRTYRLAVPRGTDTPAMAAAFSVAPGIEFAEVDGIGGIASTFPDDPGFASLYGLHNTGQAGGTADADIDAPEAWDLSKGSYDVVVAEIDTGIQADHPDLIGRVVSGWNTYDNNASTADLHGHGTHVAGTIGAIGNNNVGVTGVNWYVTLVAFRCVSAGGSGTESQCADAITRAANFTTPAPRIISMSLQYYTGTQTLQDAVNYASAAGILLIAANGNNVGNFVAYPAKFPNCMGIAASDRNDAWASFSNYGPETDVAAPGKDVYSLWKNSGYNTISGTSMATPHTSGTAALMLSANPCLSAAEIEQILKSTAEDRGTPGFDQKFGYGRINARAALEAARALAAGDMNCDCSVNGQDITAFVTALTDPGAYQAQYPGCDVMRADMNLDGSVNGGDIAGFVALLTP